MFEKYKKEIKKYDYQLQIDLILKILFIISSVVALIMIIFCNINYWIKLIIIILFEIILILIAFIIFYIKKLKRFNIKGKNIIENIQLFIEMENNNKIMFVKNLFYEFNVDTENKILYMINFYKDKYQKIEFTEIQNLFGVLIIFVGLFSDFYDVAKTGLDNDKFIFSIGMGFIAFIMYLVIVFIKWIIKTILFSTNADINEKFINTLNYFYLNYDKEFKK